MALDQESINTQLALLAGHRRTLGLLLQQQVKLGAYTPPHVLIDIQENQSAIRRIKEQLRTDGVLVEDEPNDDFLPTVVAAPSQLTSQERRNRSRLLDKVEAFWVKGVLEQSLYQIARLELGLEKAPELVAHPWQTVLQLATTRRIVQPSTPIIKVFDELDGKLLILGAPGAGKTTLLLELARDLVARAKKDDQYPIPIVFNLSTWASKRQPLKQWFVEELNQRYSFPFKLAQKWVEADAILPLLDGLDEVAEEQRAACIRAINTYMLGHGLVSLAVCSRSEEYAALSDMLKLQGAIIIQPLTEQVVDTYLHQIGSPLAAVRTLLRGDSTLRELLDTPLMLTILVLAYKDKSPAELRAEETLKQWRQRLFDDYIAAMYERSGRSIGNTAYTKEQMQRWLVWLAMQMVRHNQTVFYIERMQPDWLLAPKLRLYTPRIRILVGLVGLAFGSFIGLAFGVSLGLLVGSDFGSYFGLYYGWLIGSFIGLPAALIVGMHFGLNPVIVEEQIFEIVFGAPDTLQRRIKLVEALRWSRPLIKIELLVISLTGALYGLFIGGLLGFGRIGALLGGLFCAIGALLFGGLSGIELETKNKPNEGIRQSARNALYGAILYGLTFGPIMLTITYSLLKFYDFHVQYDSLLFIFSLLLTLASTLFGILKYGGQGIYQHYTLRWLLFSSGSFPLRPISFLNYCVDRIFLRRVGGGYIFVHRLLMEHFASMYTEQIEKAGQS